MLYTTTSCYSHVDTPHLAVCFVVFQCAVVATEMAHGHVVGWTRYKHGSPTDSCVVCEGGADSHQLAVSSNRS